MNIVFSNSLINQHMFVVIGIVTFASSCGEYITFSLAAKRQTSRINIRLFQTLIQQVRS